MAARSRRGGEAVEAIATGHPRGKFPRRYSGSYTGSYTGQWPGTGT